MHIYCVLLVYSLVSLALCVEGERGSLGATILKTFSNFMSKILLFTLFFQLSIRMFL